MANFLDDLSVYNAKAAAAITAAVTAGNQDKANMMSSLKTTANDTSLTEQIRLEALTALINLGSLLDIALPPYFPVVTTFANTQTYVGLHNDLTGLQGGTGGEYYHLTQAQLTSVLNKADTGDITFANLIGVYTDNAGLGAAINAKQNQLSGTGFVKISGTTISYDNSTYLTTISGIAAGGELQGTYPNPTLSNAAVIGKVLTGWDGSVSPAPIAPTDSILIALQKLNANINDVIASTGVTSVSLSNNATGIFTTTSTPQTGAVALSLGLNTQTGNKFLASPNGSTGQPSFRAIVTADLPNSGVTAGTYGTANQIPQIIVDSKGRITSLTTVAASSGGIVNTVVLAPPTPLFATSVTGTAQDIILNLTLGTQSANTVWAGPTTGSAAAPAFRSLVAADIPSLPISQITNLQATIDGLLTDELSDGKIWIGNISNAAVPQTLSGDVTVTRAGVTAIGTSKVLYSMIQDVTSGTFLGRYDALDGVVQQLSFDPADFVLDSGTGVVTLATPVASLLTTKGDLLSYTTTQARVPSSNVDGDMLLVNTAAAPGINWATMSGDATLTATGAITIANSAVTLGKMANLPANTVIGNNTGSSATPIALTKAQLTAMINQFTSALSGVVPASGGGTLNFLRADGSWAQPSGTGTVNSGTQYELAYYATTGTAVSSLGSTGTTTQVLHGNASGAPTWGAVALGADVSGTLPVANGGTGQTSFANGELLIGNSTGNTLSKSTLTAGTGITITNGTGTISIAVTNPASGTVNSGTQYQLAYYATNGTAVSGLTLITASRALVSDANGLPVASTTSTTQLQYLSSATGTTGTTSTNLVFSGSPTINSPIIGSSAGTGHIHMRFAGSVPTPQGTNYLTIFADKSPKTLAFLFENDAFESYFQFNATTSDKTYQFPDLSGTVTVLGNTTTGSGSTLVLATSPVLTTPSLGVATGTSLDVTGSLTSGVASTTAGTLVLRNATNAFTQTIRGTNPSASITYDLPTTAPTAGQYLQASAPVASVVTLSWATVSGGGDVTGPSSATSGNFAVFNGATGKIIQEPTTGSFDNSTGRATFNGGVDLGVSSSATGTLIFRNNTNAFTTTFQASTSQTASLSYTWPSVAPTTGQILRSDNSGNLSWVAAGAGDMVLATANQVVTGSKIYADTTLLLRNPAATFNTTLSAGTSTAARTITFPDATGTVPLLSLAQTFTALQTFTGGVTINTTALSVASAATFSLAATTGTAVSLTGAGSITTPHLSITGSTVNWMSFGVATNAAAPTYTNRSAGTKIVLGTNITGSSLDYGMGIGSAQMWLSSGGTIAFFANNTTSSGSFEYNASTAYGLHLTAASDANISVPQLNISGGTAQMIRFGNTSGNPAFTVGSVVRSAGTKIILLQNNTLTSLDYGIGVGTAQTWISSGGSITFYPNSTTVALTVASTGLTLGAGVNLVLATATGTRIGTSTSQLLSFWNKTPIVQPTTAITGATRVGGAGTTVTTTDTYGGYTLAQIAAALINTGILA